MAGETLVPSEMSTKTGTSDQPTEEIGDELPHAGVLRGSLSGSLLTHIPYRKDTKKKSTRRYAMKRLGLEKVLDLIETWELWDENIEAKGCSSALVTSSCFTTLSTFVIVINTGFVAYVTDWSMQNLGSSKPTGMMVAECAFMSWYFIELLLRIEAYRWHFLSSSLILWNAFDAMLVCISMIDVALLLSPAIEDASNDGNITYLRILRLMRLAKILRTFHVVKAFKDLSVILESLKNSFLALFWCFVFLAFMLFVFSLVFMQGAINYFEDTRSQVDEIVKTNIIDAFGTLPDTMLTLYMAVTGGEDWGAYYHLVKNTGDMYAPLYIFYTFFFGFAVVNILTGVFVEKAMAAAQPDIEQRVLDKRKEIEQQCDELKRIVGSLDTDSSGTISRSEFQELCENYFFIGYMATLGVDLKEAEFFFDFLVSINAKGQSEDRDAQSVQIDALVEGCLNMKGGATSIDQQRQLAETKELRRQVDRVTKIVLSALDDMNKKFSAIISKETAGVPKYADGVADGTVSNMPDVESTVPPLPIKEWREIEKTLRKNRADRREEEPVSQKIVEDQVRVLAEVPVMNQNLTKTTRERHPSLVKIRGEGTSTPANRNTWVIVGRLAIVNASQDPTSHVVGCLELGATVEEVEVATCSTEGGRLYYSKLSGAGPAFGWISIRSHDHTLAYPVKEETRDSPAWIHNAPS